MSHKPALLRVSQLHNYVRATLCRSVKMNESPVDLVAQILTTRHGLLRGGLNARSFIEKHRNLVLASQTPKKQKKSARRATVNAAITSLRPTQHVPAPNNVAGDEFLQTYEWRRLRMAALKLHGARCQCCGATPATGAVMNVDHIKPRKLFPELALSIDNLQILCHVCNHGKGNWDMTDWRQAANVP